jgi:hypothetical protein
MTGRTEIITSIRTKAVALFSASVPLVLLRFSHCELLLLEDGSKGRGQLGNWEEGERPPLEAATEQQLVKT